MLALRRIGAGLVAACLLAGCTPDSSGAPAGRSERPDPRSERLRDEGDEDAPSPPPPRPRRRPRPQTAAAAAATATAAPDDHAPDDHAPDDHAPGTRSVAPTRSLAATGAGSALAATGAGSEERPRALRVLPRSWSVARVKRYMEHEIERGLGVTCAFCHDEDDYAATHAHQDVARAMIRMTRALNRRYFGGRNAVTCFVCHQGEAGVAGSSVGGAGPRSARVLPRSASKREIKRVMRRISKALGVQCSHCHLKGDMEADTPTKETARRMMRMVRAINARHLRRHGARVTCATCHRGRERPSRGF